MNSKRQTLLWVSLFAAIIIVPTLCLLWFMEQAVRNERLSTRERIISLYRERVERFNWELLPLFTPSNLHQTDASIDEIVGSFRRVPIDGLIILEDAKVLYPQNRQIETNSIQQQDTLWKMEFREKRFRDAVKAYDALIKEATTKGDSLRYMMASARCYKKLHDTTKAISIYEQINSSIPLTDSTTTVAYAQIALVKLYNANEIAKRDALLHKILTKENFQISSEIRRFRLRSALSVLPTATLNDAEKSMRKQFEHALDFEKLSNSYISPFTDEEISDSTKDALLISIDSLYYCTFSHEEKRLISLIQKKSILSGINTLTEHFNEPLIEIHALDDVGQKLNTEKSTNKLLLATVNILTTDKGSYTLEFYLDEVNTLSSKLKDQQATYLWIGFLSVLFIVICGTAAGYFFIHHSNLNKLKNTFLATVTHELKTPISSCRILVDTLLDRKVTAPEKVTEYYQLISQENQRLSRLVDNFLTFSKMERNKQSFQRTECTLSEIIAVSLESMSVKFRNPQCRFSSNLPEEEVTLYANFDALVTVVTNLLDNAYKYSLSEKEITLAATIRETMLEISVSDRGIGIAKKDQKRIFQKFYQVNQNLNRQREGCGLGLSIVHYIVTAHLGTITVDSKENQGTTFTVTLPI